MGLLDTSIEERVNNFPPDFDEKPRDKELSPKKRRYFSGSIEDIFEKNGMKEKVRNIYDEVLEVVEALPYAGEIKLTDDLKSEVVQAAISLNSLVNIRLGSPEAIVEIDRLIMQMEGVGTDEHGDIDLRLERESKARDILRHKMTRENVNLVMSESLKFTHARNLLIIIEIVMEDGEIVVSEDQRHQFFEDIEEAEAQVGKTERACDEFCDKVHSWYERLIPTDRPLSLVDRRHGGLSSKVRGFELLVNLPSNYEVYEHIPQLLPPSITIDDIDEVRYSDFFSNSEALNFLHDDGRITIIFYKNIIPELFFERFRHELGHSFADMKPDLMEYLDWVRKMLKRDREEFGKDIFSTGISPYPISMIHEGQDPGEVIAELWCCAGDPELRERIIKELPYETRILYDLENSEALKGLNLSSWVESGD